MAAAALAIDVGGTKLAAGVVDASGRVLSRSRRPTPAGPDGEVVYAALLETAREALDRGAGTQPPERIGVGCGGPMKARAGLVSPLNIPGWRDFPLVTRLEGDLGLPAVVDNDAKAFALGEYLFGAGRGHPHMLGVVVSTGVGGGIISGGALLHGRTDNAGHVGHLVAEPDGPACVCGGRGCVEAVASGPSIVRLLRAAVEAGGGSALASAMESGFTARDAAEAAMEGDALARAAFERAGRALGIGFANAAALLDLDLIVVGGGVSAVGDLLFAPLGRSFAAHAQLDYVRDRVAIVPSAMGYDAGLIGAAALALAHR